MHSDCVERRRWVGDEEFARALQFAMVLPGPEAQQLATWIGWRLAGTRGALAAGLAFVLPGAITIAVLSIAYVALQDLPGSVAALGGLRAAVVAVLLGAFVRLARRALRSTLSLGSAIGAAAAIVLGAPFLAVVGMTACFGAVLGWIRPSLVPREVERPGVSAPPRTGLLRTAALWLTLWWAPLPLLHLFASAGPLPALFQSVAQAAGMSFGGAYAMLAVISDTFVHRWSWVSPQQMADALAFAEATPGPLVIVVQFVAFLAGWSHPGPFSVPWTAALASILALWATFTPSFLWILAFAPSMDRLATMAWLRAAFAGAAAAAVVALGHLALSLVHGAWWDIGGTETPMPSRVLLTGLGLLGLRLGVPMPAVLAIGLAAGLVLGMV